MTQGVWFRFDLSGLPGVHPGLNLLRLSSRLESWEHLPRGSMLTPCTGYLVGQFQEIKRSAPHVRDDVFKLCVVLGQAFQSGHSSKLHQGACCLCGGFPNCTKVGNDFGGW
jgi:hypothetical protein